MHDPLSRFFTFLVAASLSIYIWLFLLVFCSFSLILFSVSIDNHGLCFVYFLSDTFKHVSFNKPFRLLQCSSFTRSRLLSQTYTQVRVEEQLWRRKIKSTCLLLVYFTHVLSWYWKCIVSHPCQSLTSWWLHSLFNILSKVKSACLR